MICSELWFLSRRYAVNYLGKKRCYRRGLYVARRIFTENAGRGP